MSAGGLRTEPASGRAAGLLAWLLSEGRHLPSQGELLEALCARLVAAGVPVDRVGLHVRTLHPQIRASRTLWRQGAAGAADTHYGAQDDLDAAYRQSPFFVVYGTGAAVRRRLNGPGAAFDFPILAELQAEGLSDYLVTPLIFGTGQIHAATWAARNPAGFSEADIETISSLLPALAALAEIHEARRLTRTLLDTYLGHQAGGRVLSGGITRGSAETIACALWFCDLRGFTALSERLSRDALIDLLNDYFACMAAPVQARGGEVLKFVGDAMLAIFPIADDLDRDRACLTALAAAEDALQALDQLNAEREAKGMPSIEVGIALHTGGVMYGNIGAPDRLDFTVIGPAVNLVTRLEDLCSPLGVRLVASERFASPCGSRMQSLGRHRLKGVEQELEVFGLPEN